MSEQFTISANGGSSRYHRSNQLSNPADLLGKPTVNFDGSNDILDIDDPNLNTSEHNQKTIGFVVEVSSDATTPQVICREGNKNIGLGFFIDDEANFSYLGNF